jgi:hypothetical protein
MYVYVFIYIYSNFKYTNSCLILSFVNKVSMGLLQVGAIHLVDLCFMYSLEMRSFAILRYLGIFQIPLEPLEGEGLGLSSQLTAALVNAFPAWDGAHSAPLGAPLWRSL